MKIELKNEQKSQSRSKYIVSILKEHFILLQKIQLMRLMIRIYVEMNRWWFYRLQKNGLISFLIGNQLLILSFQASYICHGYIVSI